MTSDALADLLETLVNLPSVTGQEAEIADWLGDRLARGGRGEVLRSGRSLVWRSPRRDRPLLVLAGHIDTVPPKGNARARRDGSRLYGLGSTDMKSGDAVMLSLIETLDPARLRFDVAAAFYEGEEGSLETNGLKRLLAEMPWLRQARLAILLEPTELRAELGCSGAMNVAVRVAGRAAHSARPWTGVNAVEVAAPWLAEITRVPVIPHTIHGIEYRETLQVTTLTAGRARNVVPDELVANLNHRFPPGRSIAEAEARVRSLVPEAFGFEVVDAAPAGEVSLDRPEVREFIDRFGLAVAGKQGWTDVAQFTSAGVPALNYGPGIPELCHVVDEYCPVDNLERAYRTLAEFLTDRR